MTIKQFFKSIFLNQPNSISSKRICGVLGWLLCLGVLGYCTYKEIQAPVMVDTIVVTSAALLGVDSIMNIWKRPKEPLDDNNYQSV